MRPQGTLSAGFAALRRWRLVLLLTFSAALLGGFAASPIVPAMQSAFAETLAGDHILANHPEFAATDVIDFLREKAPAVAGVRSALGSAALLGLLLQIFFTGGIVETLGRASDLSRESFWAGSRRHFRHNLKCFAIFTLAILVFVGGWLALTGGIAKKIFETAPPNTAGRSVWNWAVFAVGVFIFGVLKLWADFARASRRSAPSGGAMAAFRDARRRLSGRWIRGLALLLVWAVVGAVGFALLISLAWGQATPTPGAVTVNLVLLLLLLMVRPACVVGAWGSILALSDASPAPRLRELPRAVVIPVEAPPEVPFRADDFPRPSGPADPAPGE